MTLVEKATIIHYHRHRIGEHSSDTIKAKALGWVNETSQMQRFAALATVADLNGRSLLDIGCGYGDLKAYFDTKFHNFSYVGIDQMPEFVTEARSLYGQRPSCYFCLADFTEQNIPSADYVFASGVLSYRCKEESFYFSMIKKMYDAANEALAFNMLDVENFPIHPLLIGHHAEAVQAYCQTLSPDVRLIRNYLDDDFTVLVYKK